MHFGLLVVTLLAAEQRRVAVLEFDASKATADIDRTYFSDLVRGAVHKVAPQLLMMTRESTMELLKASGKKLEDCVGECEVETGKLLGADYVVSGRITKIGTRYSLTLRLHATASGELLSTAEARGKSLDELVDAAATATQELEQPLRSPTPAAAANPSSPAREARASGPTLVPKQALGPATPSNAPVQAVDHYERGVALVNEQNYSGALPEFDRALAIKPDFAFALIARGSAKVGSGRYAEAIDDYLAARRADPSLAAALFGLGEANRALGNRDQAASYYAEFLASEAADATPTLKEIVRKKLESVHR